MRSSAGTHCSLLCTFSLACWALDSMNHCRFAGSPSIGMLKCPRSCKLGAYRSLKQRDIRENCWHHLLPTEKMFILVSEQLKRTLKDIQLKNPAQHCRPEALLIPVVRRTVSKPHAAARAPRAECVEGGTGALALRRRGHVCKRWAAHLTPAHLDSPHGSAPDTPTTLPWHMPLSWVENHTELRAEVSCSRMVHPSSSAVPQLTCSGSSASHGGSVGAVGPCFPAVCCRTHPGGSNTPQGSALAAAPRCKRPGCRLTACLSGLLRVSASATGQSNLATVQKATAFNNNKKTFNFILPE